MIEVSVQLPVCNPYAPSIPQSLISSIPGFFGLVLLPINRPSTFVSFWVFG